MKMAVVSACLSVVLATPLAAGQIDFGAYYTQLNTGQPWEAFSRTGKYADIVVQLSKAGGKLVFWRGNSYLPYGKTDKAQWDLAEVVTRSGDVADQLLRTERKLPGPGSPQLDLALILAVELTTAREDRFSGEDLDGRHDGPAGRRARQPG